jgi:hypothetical protein
MPSQFWQIQVVSIEGVVVGRCRCCCKRRYEQLVLTFMYELSCFRYGWGTIICRGRPGQPWSNLVMEDERMSQVLLYIILHSYTFSGRKDASK